MTKEARQTEVSEPVAADAPKGAQPICGIVMPIADFQGRTADHWAGVRNLIERAAEQAGTTPRAVWLGESVEIIQDRIVHNLFGNDIIVADVSALNPNVMFEVGMRLTYGKPTILIADDETTLPFDTRMIDHLFYPRTLGFHRIEAFIGDLADRIIKLLEAGENYRSFISRFEPLDIVKPTTREVGPAELVANRLDRIETTLSTISLVLNRRSASEVAFRYDAMKGAEPGTFHVPVLSGGALHYLIDPAHHPDFGRRALEIPAVKSVSGNRDGPESSRLTVELSGSAEDVMAAEPRLNELARAYAR